MFTVIPPDGGESQEIKANKSSFGNDVENAGVVTDTFADGLSPEMAASTANGPDETVFTFRVTVAV